jgi:hypothetical protein
MLPEIEATIGAIRSVRNARYLATERGYQGAFYCTLRSELERMERLSAERILELEYQKTVGRHGTRQRPDIVFPHSYGNKRRRGVEKQFRSLGAKTFCYVGARNGGFY